MHRQRGLDSQRWTATTCTPNNATTSRWRRCALPSRIRQQLDRPPARAGRHDQRVVASCTAAAASRRQLDYDRLSDADRHPQRAGRELRASAGHPRQWLSDFHLSDAVAARRLVSSCTAAAAASGHSWTATTAPRTTPATCPHPARRRRQRWGTARRASPAPATTSSTSRRRAPRRGPTADNLAATITCNPLTTTDVTVSCSDSSGGPGDNYVTTTCTLNSTTNVPLASSTPISPNPGKATPRPPARCSTADRPAQRAAPLGVRRLATTTSPRPAQHPHRSDAGRLVHAGRAGPAPTDRDDLHRPRDGAGPRGHDRPCGSTDRHSELANNFTLSTAAASGAKSSSRRRRPKTRPSTAVARLRGPCRRSPR